MPSSLAARSVTCRSARVGPVSPVSVEGGRGGGGGDEVPGCWERRCRWRPVIGGGVVTGAFRPPTWRRGDTRRGSRGQEAGVVARCCTCGGW